MFVKCASSRTEQHTDFSAADFCEQLLWIIPKQFFPIVLRSISILSILKWCSTKMVILNLHGEYLPYLMQCILNSSSVFLRIRALENVKIQTARITTHEPVVDQRRFIAVNLVRCLWRNAWNVIENGKPRTNHRMTI